MKKIALLILVCVIGVSLSAYESGFVVFGGATMSWASGRLSEADSKIGFHGGVSMEHFGIIPNTILETGLRFNMKGFDYVERRSSGYQSSYYFFENISMSYVDFFAKVKLDIGNLPIYPYFGGYAAFLLSAQSEGQYGGDMGSYSWHEEWNKDAKDDLNTFDFGLLIGADLVIKDKFYLGVGFDFGLSNFYTADITVGASTDSVSSQTRGLLFSVGYIF